MSFTYIPNLFKAESSGCLSAPEKPCSQNAGTTAILLPRLFISVRNEISTHRDLQEITPHLWNAVNVTQDTLSIVTKMMLSVEFKVDRCRELAGKNFATATDLADIMVREKQIPFRTAHKIVGRIVNEATANDIAEEDITSKFIDDIALELGFDELNLEDELIQRALNPAENVRIRAVPGGPAPEMVEIARDNIKVFLNDEFERHGI